MSGGGGRGIGLTADVSTPPSGDPPTTTATRRIARAGWLVVGLVCVALGGIGIVVPGLPTTVFFIAAAACFTRSSPRLEAWVLSLPKIGPAVRDYRDGRGMPRSAKVAAVAMIAASVTLSLFLVSSTAVRFVIVVAGVVGCWYVLRVPTRDDEQRVES